MATLLGTKGQVAASGGRVMNRPGFTLRPWVQITAIAVVAAFLAGCALIARPPYISRTAWEAMSPTEQNARRQGYEDWLKRQDYEREEIERELRDSQRIR